MKTSIGIIPARYASTRFPGKPLVDIAGKIMIQRVYEQAIQSNLNQVIIATDDQRIYDAVKTFGGEVMMTGAHENGTSRCVEVLKKLEQRYDIMVNVQGDEPFIRPEQINLVLQAFELADTQIATLAKKIEKLEHILNPNIVKVVRSQFITNGICNALYFSRSPIPFVRDLPPEKWLETHCFYKHIGLYAFSSSFLLEQYPALQKSQLEPAEMLEQLSWLENNIPIRILETNFETPNIDRPEDLYQLTIEN